MLGTEIYIRKPSEWVFPVADNHVDLRRQTVSLLRVRPSTGLRSFSLRPHGRLERNMDGGLLVGALPWRCFPAVQRQLQNPPPTMIRPYPHRRKKTPQLQVPPVDMSGFEENQALKRSIGLDEREILTLVYK
jgi:hypothetical protein